jgi:hydrogenase/urease accessory protein HupE
VTRAGSVVAVGLTVLTSAPPALAHVQQGHAQGLLTGLGHPVSGLDHVLAMVSVGLWGAQLGSPALWLLPVTFPTSLYLFRPRQAASQRDRVNFGAGRALSTPGNDV